MSADLKYMWLAVLELQDVIVGAEITFVCSAFKTVNQNLLDPNLLYVRFS
jgi:hypothetical protein